MPTKELYKLTNIRMAGNEHGRLTPDTIYAELHLMSGPLVIAATLVHILKTIRDENLAVEGVSVTHKIQRGAYCSTTELEFYT